MSIAASIVGTYRLPCSLAPGKEEFMHVGSDGRIVHFVYADAVTMRIQDMRLWAEPLGGDRYQIRGKPGTEGWPVSLVATVTGMRIERAEKIFELTRAEVSELPEWYAERLAKALERMSKQEAQVGEENDGGPGESPEPPRGEA